MPTRNVTIYSTLRVYATGVALTIVEPTPTYFAWIAGPTGELDKTGGYTIGVYDQTGNLYIGEITNVTLQLVPQNSYNVDPNFFSTSNKFLNVGSITSGTRASANGEDITLNRTIVQADSYQATMALSVFSNDFPSMTASLSPSFNPWNAP